jgi:hypothetical protein
MTTATEIPNRVQDLRTLELKLAQIRDELRVKKHLARADARDRWDALELKWARFTARSHDLRSAADEAAEDVWRGVQGLGRELADGYEAIRRAL